MAGILRPTAGRLAICGCDIAADPIAAKQQLAFVPDDPRLFDSLTVWEHLEFIAAAYRVPAFAADAEPLLEQFELTEKRNTVARSFRGGCGRRSPSAALSAPPGRGAVRRAADRAGPRGIRTLKDSIRQRAAAGAAVIVTPICYLLSRTFARTC